MDRIENGKIKYKELFNAPEAFLEDEDFFNIYKNFVFGEVFYNNVLSDREKYLITLVVLTVNQTLDCLKSYTEAFLNAGLDPIEIKEAVYQCAPYIGFSKVFNSLKIINEVFKEKKISLPLKSRSTTSEENRLEKGIKVQKEIFGSVIDNMRENAPKNQAFMQDYLSAMCFGDFYTREGLDLQTRELLTLCMVSSLGGADLQVKGHVQGNLNMGNYKEKLISAIAHCLPYIGFPRFLNALSAVNEIAK